MLGTAGEILQDSASDPRLAAASSSSSSSLALEMLGMGNNPQQHGEERSGRTGEKLVVEAAARGKALPLSGRGRGAQTLLQGGVVALAGAMSVEQRGGAARGQKEGPLLRRSVEAEDEHEAHYR